MLVGRGFDRVGRAGPSLDVFPQPRCAGKLVYRRTIAIGKDPFEEYRCNTCGKWVYIQENGDFKIETPIRL